MNTMQKRKYRIKLVTRYGTYDISTIQRRISIFGISFWINIKHIDDSPMHKRWRRGEDHDRPFLGTDEIMNVAYYDMHGNKIPNE